MGNASLLGKALFVSMIALTLASPASAAQSCNKQEKAVQTAQGEVNTAQGELERAKDRADRVQYQNEQAMIRWEDRLSELQSRAQTVKEIEENKIDEAKYQYNLCAWVFQKLCRSYNAKKQASIRRIKSAQQAVVTHQNRKSTVEKQNASRTAAVQRTVNRAQEKLLKAVAKLTIAVQALNQCQAPVTPPAS